MVKVKKERLSKWIERWDESQWNSIEMRTYLISVIRDGEEVSDKLSKIEPLYEEQERYIKLLERQLELLQKTLDLAEKLAPRLVCIPGSSEVVK